MTDRKRNGSATIPCIVGIAVALAALYFLPELIRKKHYEVKVTSLSPASFPLDFSLGRFPESSKTTLAALLKSHPRGLIVNFWATWCPPCLDELPSLEILGRQLKGLGKEKYPQLVTISVDEKSEEVRRLLDSLRFKASFPILLDPLGKMAQSIGTTKFPETYWLDSEGKLLHKWVGPQDWNGQDVLKRLVER